MARTNRGNLEAGIPVVGEVNLITQFCLAIDIQGQQDLSQVTRAGLEEWKEGRGRVPTSRDLSLLVIESLYS